MAIGLRRLQLAAYLQSTPVVVRRGDRAPELTLAGFRHWSEPPGDGVDRAGAGHVLVTWAIVRPDGGKVVARGTTNHRRGGWRVGDYAGLVALLDAGVYALSVDLMSSLEKLAGR